MKLTDVEIDCRLELAEKRLIEEYNNADPLDTYMNDKLLDDIALVQAVMQERAWRKGANKRQIDRPLVVNK